MRLLRIKPLVRQVQNEDAVLAVDDSISHKPHTDASELIGWHYGHTTGTSVKGINFLTTLSCTAEVSLPVAFALVEKDEAFTDKKTGQVKRRATVSRNAHCQTMLKACVKSGMPFRHVLTPITSQRRMVCRVRQHEADQNRTGQRLCDALQVQPQHRPVWAGQERRTLSTNPNTGA